MFVKEDLLDANSTVDWIHIFEWYVVRCGSKNEPQKGVWKSFGLLDQNMLAIVRSIDNMIGKGCEGEGGGIWPPNEHWNLHLDNEQGIQMSSKNPLTAHFTSYEKWSPKGKQPNNTRLPHSRSLAICLFDKLLRGLPMTPINHTAGLWLVSVVRVLTERAWDQSYGCQRQG